MSRKYTAQEMRDMADQILITDDDWYEDAGYMLRQAADMIERESTREKSSAVGNAAAMREALLKASIVLKEATHHRLTEEYINECRALIHSALSAPPRNCDRYTIAEALRKYGFPTKSNPWGEREWLDFCEWLFDEAKGENDGSR